VQECHRKGGGGHFSDFKDFMLFVYLASLY